MEQPSLPADPARTRPDRLLFFTTVSSCDGTVAMLAATGVLADLAGAIVAGLTTVAGAGAWIAAHETYAGRRLTRRDKTGLLLIALLAATATLTATALGVLLPPDDLRFLPAAAGLALLLVALEVAGLRLPRLGRLSLPLVLIACALTAEVTLHWT